MSSNTPATPLRQGRIAYCVIGSPGVQEQFYNPFRKSLCRESLPETGHTAKNIQFSRIRGWGFRSGLKRRSYSMRSRIGFPTNILNSWEYHNWAGHVKAIWQASSKQIFESALPIKLKGEKRYGWTCDQEIEKASITLTCRSSLPLQ